MKQNSPHVSCSMPTRCLGALMLAALAVSAPLASDAAFVVPLDFNPKEYKNLNLGNQNLSGQTLVHYSKPGDKEINYLWLSEGAQYVESAYFWGTVTMDSKYAIMLSDNSTATAGKIVITLDPKLAKRFPDGVCDISHIDVEAMSLNPKYTAPCYVNSVRYEFPNDQYETHSFVIPESDSHTNTITLEAAQASQLSVAKIFIYFNLDPVISIGSLTPEMEYNETGCYIFPDAAYSDVARDNILARLKGVGSDEEPLVLVWDDNNKVYSLTDSNLEEGLYQLDYTYDAFGITSTTRKPRFNDASPYYVSIYPSVTGIRLNWGSALVDNIIYVPEEVGEGANKRTLENAIISGLRDGITVYWKTSQSLDLSSVSSQPQSSERTAGNESAFDATANAVTPDELLAAGYERYNSRGVNLATDGHNVLHLYLEKNGVMSKEYAFQYRPWSDRPSTVDVTLSYPDNAAGLDPQYYTLDGIELAPEDARHSGKPVVKRSGNKASIIIMP